MEFDKANLEGKKYQDLVKLAKEHDVYRRYAPKAEIIERLLDLNKVAPANDETLLSDISMPSLDISEDESLNLSVRTRRNKNDTANKSGLSNRSALKEVKINNHSVRKTRKTVAFVTPEHSPVKSVSATKRIVRVSTPAKPAKSPVVKSARKSAMANSTPAVAQRNARRADCSQENELENTYIVEETAEPSPIQKDFPKALKREVTFEITKSGSETELFKREGTFEIITVDNNGKRVSEVVATNGEPLSPLDASWNNRSRSSRMSTPVSDLETKTPPSVSVKELCLLFEPEVVKSNKKEMPAGLPPSSRASNVSPQFKPRSTRSSVLRASLRKSDIKSSANISLPSTARKVFVTNRGKPTGYVKPPSMKNLSFSKKTPKLKSPSVAREIQLKQQAVSAKKMLEATSATKSKIPPPRKVPNFGEMHAKMYSKMESLIDAKQKVLDKAQEYETSGFPRCAVATPKFFSAETNHKFTKVDRPADSRPVAARQLKMPEKSRIPGRAKDVTDSAFPAGILPLSGQKLTSKNLEKPKRSPPKLMPVNRLISRLPVFQSTHTSNRSGTSFTLTNKAPAQIQKMKETIVTKAPVKKVQDITSKNRNVLQNVRTNRRFELQMQHRMKF